MKAKPKAASQEAKPATDQPLIKPLTKARGRWRPEICVAKRTKAQRAADLVIIEREAIRGAYPGEIAEIIAKKRPYRISPPMVAYELKKLRDKWQSEASELIATEKTAALYRLRRQYREVLEAWEKSKRDAMKEMREQSTGQNSGTKKRTTKEGQCGNPAFQKLLIEIEEMIAKLLGTNAPIKSQQLGADGQPVDPAAPVGMVVNISTNLSEEELPT